jgi:S-DNA-T family DNA segregation ATPase FtsK/SpoIIIE
MISQAHHSNKRKTSSRKSRKRRIIEHELREILFIFFCFMGLYLLVSLLTYAPNSDPGIWRSPQALEIQNQGGIAGALFADIFFYIFGYVAYLFPLMVAYIGWLIYKGKHYEILQKPKSLIIPTIGFILTLSAGCGLAIVHFMAESALLPTHAGGILGIWVGESLESIVESFGATLILLTLFFTGVTLLTGFSWLRLMDSLGYHTLTRLPILRRYLNQKFFPWIIKFTLTLLRLVQHWSKSAYKHWQDKQPIHNKSNNDSSTFEIWQDHAPIKPIPSLLPAFNLLEPASNFVTSPDINHLAEQMTKAFTALKFQVEINGVYPGPVLTSFEVQTITPINNNYLDELGEALKKELKIENIQIVENELGLLDIKIENWERQTIYLSELLNSPDYQNNHSPLAIALGQNVSGKPVIADLRFAPHLLIVSDENSEQTMAINTLILSLLYKSSPETMRLVIIDNSNIYADLPHLLSPVITDLTQMPEALNWCVQEMKRRYHLMANKGIRNIENWHQDSSNLAMPYIILIIKNLEPLNIIGVQEQVGESITNLIQKSRAAGIHIILAITSSEINKVTTLIKAHIPTRIAFKLANQTASRRILATNGAEILLGKGDMLYMTAGILSRVHGSFVSEQEVENVVADLKARAKPNYIYFNAQS